MGRVRGERRVNKEGSLPLVSEPCPLSFLSFDALELKVGDWNGQGAFFRSSGGGMGRLAWSGPPHHPYPNKCKHPKMQMKLLWRGRGVAQ